MFLKTKIKKIKHTRVSKCGVEHKYVRTQTIAVFRCDNCNDIFERSLKKIQRKRLSNRYFHCCSNCNSKRFAQRKGVEQKKIWDMPAGTDLPVGKY
jgi:hypothetical protein